MCPTEVILHIGGEVTPRIHLSVMSFKIPSHQLEGGQGVPVVAQSIIFLYASPDTDRVIFQLTANYRVRDHCEFAAILAHLSTVVPFQANSFYAQPWNQRMR